MLWTVVGVVLGAFLGLGIGVGLGLAGFGQSGAHSDDDWKKDQEIEDLKKRIEEMEKKDDQEPK